MDKFQVSPCKRAVVQKEGDKRRRNPFFHSSQFFSKKLMEVVKHHHNLFGTENHSTGMPLGWALGELFGAI